MKLSDLWDFSDPFCANDAPEKPMKEKETRAFDILASVAGGSLLIGFIFWIFWNFGVVPTFGVSTHPRYWPAVSLALGALWLRTFLTRKGPIK